MPSPRACDINTPSAGTLLLESMPLARFGKDVIRPMERASNGSRNSEGGDQEVTPVRR